MPETWTVISLRERLLLSLPLFPFSFVALSSGRGDKRKARNYSRPIFPGDNNASVRPRGKRGWNLAKSRRVSIPTTDR